MISPTNSDVGLTREGPPPPFAYRGVARGLLPDRHPPLRAADISRDAPGRGARRAREAARPAAGLRARRRERLLEGHARRPVPPGGARGSASRSPASAHVRSRSDGATTRSWSGSRARARRAWCSAATRSAATLRLLEGAARAGSGVDVPIMAGDTFARTRRAALFAEAGAGAPRPVRRHARRAAHRAPADRGGPARRPDGRRRNSPACSRRRRRPSSCSRRSPAPTGRAPRCSSGCAPSKVKDGILGTFRFDRNGDMTPGWVPIVRITRATDRGYPTAPLTAPSSTAR